MVQRTIEELGDAIAELAAHIDAARCRWLLLVAEFDEREGWSTLGHKSCAHWLALECSIAPGAAREHVRVARRLGALPLVLEAFSRGELSYSKVRALTRLDNVAREAELVEMARHATAADVERAVRDQQWVLRAEAGTAHEERFLSVTHDDGGSILIKGRLPREAGALLLKALEAASDRLYQEAKSVPAGTSVTVGLDRRTRYADALAELAETALTAQAHAARSGGDRYQVVVHIDQHGLTGQDVAERSELEDGAPLATETVRRIACDASIVPLIERAGRPVSVGRKTRSIPPAVRRALRSRDGGCCFPGCTQRRGVDAHHITHWAHGGETSLGNLVELCRHHHRLVHEGGFSVERCGGGLLFRRPDGKILPRIPRPRRGDPECVVEDNRRLRLGITARTPVPLSHGERLDRAAGVDALLLYAPPAPEPAPAPGGERDTSARASPA